MVVSNQSSNISTQNQANGTNVQVNQPTNTSTSAKKVYDIKN